MLGEFIHLEWNMPENFDTHHNMTSVIEMKELGGKCDAKCECYVIRG